MKRVLNKKEISFVLNCLKVFHEKLEPNEFTLTSYCGDNISVKFSCSLSRLYSVFKEYEQIQLV